MKQFVIVMMLALLMLPVLAAAQDCSETCDMNHSMAIMECDMMMNDGMMFCEDMLMMEESECWALDTWTCYMECQGDPQCMMMCDQQVDICMMNAWMNYEACTMPLYDQHMMCITVADIDHQACLTECVVPTGKQTWGELKARYK